MKKLITASLIFFGMANALASNQPQSEDDFINNAIKDGYQAQRNLAFFYQTGSGNFGGNDYIAKNETKSCAWRKILLFANPGKTDSTDPMNERESCRNLNFEQDEKVWQMVYHYIPLIDAEKAKGNYMVQKDDPTPTGDLGIIDVSPQ
ncbi:hypothetical protein ACCY16_02050 [Candidatus Pantoea formicae]|uniref:hypothetical protein n=1 Tax=Candidatus Pantoea formicae TaxID=2608355 RepID=UPI003ED8E60E